MMVGDVTSTKVGQPFVAGSSVEAVVEQQTRAPKVFIYKKRRRKNSQRFKGFRAAVTSLRIKVPQSEPSSDAMTGTDTEVTPLPGHQRSLNRSLFGFFWCGAWASYLRGTRTAPYWS